MGRREGGRGGEGGGEKRQVGQPMQILPEQRANQGGRQPLQRSGLPLVTGKEMWGNEQQRRRSMEERNERVRGKLKGMYNSATSIPGITFLSQARGSVVSLSPQQHVTSSSSMFRWFWKLTEAKPLNLKKKKKERSMHYAHGNRFSEFQKGWNISTLKKKWQRRKASSPCTVNLPVEGDLLWALGDINTQSQIVV